MSAIPQAKGHIVSIVSIDSPHEIVLPRHKPATTRLMRLWVAILIWHQKREGRRALRHMTADQLKDIGLSQTDAAREISKSFFWD
ncbi:uncharacterized protein YjiS (DUF1127 family) [Rhizobium sp. BK529]|uniref:DUF1127 domain-containing protein n=1 Tax=unclassified Rhizobium TaxID=2613769 RepID=UPI00104901EE|nr:MULTISPECIES: DUF1127 domain-containing protein [unclassified Rhizobium]MBB3591116.1 uncharacterized protein YjiS (DUF1127 family) [Rhizobium sp. BK529]TCS08929.1 uncharacterized protein YjiS (DUF1127 family) [Rhizobium sp. BK418]